MKSTLFATLIAVGLSCVGPSSVAIAAEASPDARFGGRWVESNGPTPPHVFETQMVSGRLKLIIAPDMAPPRGRMLFLDRVGPDIFKTPPGDDVSAQFSLTGPGKAHLDLKTFSVQWTSVTSTDLVRR